MHTVLSAIRPSHHAALTFMGTHVHARPSLCLVLGGSYEESIRGRTVEHGLGSLLFCPPREPHAQRFGRRGVRKLVLSPSAEALDWLGQHVALREAPFVHDPEVAALGQRLAGEVQRADVFSGLAIDGLSQALLATLARGQLRAGRPSERRLQAALDFLVAHACEPLSLAAVAQAAACPASTLPRAFRQRFGLTLSAQQRRLRVDRAATMLGKPQLPISDIAQACGYCDQAHFSRAFKAETGVTPGQFRAGC